MEKRQGRARACGLGADRALLTPPTHTHSVTLTLLLPDGTRTSVKGLAGTPLSSLLADRADDLASSVPAIEGVHAPPPPIALAPSGRGAVDAVVEVPAEVAAMVAAPVGEEARQLEELAVTVKPTTRFASAVVLDQSFDGATLALAQVRPWATL